MSDRLPRLFGKYVLLKSLARGGMGEIYLAASDQAGGLSKLCVIKKIITEKTDRAKTNRFLDEAKVVLRLSHGNLVPTFDAGDVGGELFIAMELVEGKDLREVWNRCVRTRTRIPLDVALHVVRETARALGYVHSYGNLKLVHRDVAPPNILLSYYGEVKLTDFGLARSALKQEHTAPGVVFGRASYLAPEQARGEIADGRTDVYSLGIVLWELLTGQPYLQLGGLDPVTALSLVRNPKTAPPSSQAPWIVPELDALVLKALAADRANRFQTAEEMRRALSDVMTRVAPRADAERVAEFLHGIYADVRAEEAVERDRMLNVTLPRFRGEPQLTPPATDVPVVAAEEPKPSAPEEKRREPGAAVVIGEPAPELPEDTVVARVAETAAESLHTSALRARAGSNGRRAPSGESGTGAETKVWRRTKVAPAEGVGQTFVGRVIDNRYRIGKRIGEGGMGTVYAAEHVDIGKSVAVKILRRQFSGDKQLVERFRREARAASRVGHPHIIDVTDFGTTEDGCAYFVMEHLEGMDLADVLAHEGQLEPTRTMRIAVQICQALRAAHQAGIIHRDLKPENIFLVARDGQADFVKVLDFGIARNLSPETSRLTNPGMTMGTPEYMAPEQVLGRPADARSDVYSLGALIYEMLLGMPPFRAATGDTMLDQKLRPLSAIREQRAEVPAALDAIIAATMAPDPNRRPQAMAALEYELTKILSGRAQAITELLGLREFSAPQVDTPVSFAGSAPVVAPRMRPAELEAFLEADLSPQPQLTDVIGPGPRATGNARPALKSPMAFPAVGASAGPPPGTPRLMTPRISAQRPVLAEVTGPVAVPRGSSNRVAAFLAAAGVVAVGAWFFHRGQPEALHQMILRLGARPNPVPVALQSPPPGRAAPLSSAYRASRPPGLPAPHAPIAPNAAAGHPPGPLPPTAARGPLPAPIAAPASTPMAAAPLAARPAAPVPSVAAGGSPTAIASPRAGAPEIVPASPIGRARAALASGAPDEAIALLRPTLASRDPAIKPLLVDALVASGTKAMGAYHWALVTKRAREALAVDPTASSSRGAHALLADALFVQGDVDGAIGEYQRAIAEAPKDARLRRHLTRARRQVQQQANDRGAPAEAADSTPSESAAE